MDPICHIFLLLLAFHKINPAVLSCVTGCSCSQDSFGRSLLCMSALLRQIPANIPQDIRKIRIENSHLTELPRGSFENVSALEYLWLNFNNITVMHIKSLEYLPALKELRLQGNKLSSVPWTAFQDTPALKILDLKHNRLDVLPEHALRYLPNLTYLDLSSNQLTVISRDVFYSWPVYQRSQRVEGQIEAISNAVLALHDNPWICDCRLRGFVQFIKSVGPPIILMNSYLTCSSPKFRAGKFFHEVELNSCMKPLTSALDTNLTVPVGLNVTLTCFVQASPSPAVWWTYALKLLRAFNAFNRTSCYFHQRMVCVSEMEPAPQWLALARARETWYTLLVGRYDAAQKDTIYIGPGVNTYSVTDLLPATKYEVCVAVRNQAPRKGQCVVFVTGSDISQVVLWLWGDVGMTGTLGQNRDSGTSGQGREGGGDGIWELKLQIAQKCECQGALRFGCRDWGGRAVAAPVTEGLERWGRRTSSRASWERTVSWGNPWGDGACGLGDELMLVEDEHGAMYKAGKEQTSACNDWPSPTPANREEQRRL
ncbi:leucine-rich repeat, immunoglobulin-like domain and transmembrane domain-containing protein 2 [Egretta garzetta]|uniref:leucine-rich repeat, immunoglobulin-like domain and transmembrane domain-containing protein 2 n=1 Tax=Egretta garzetta TaxID=188379 RepID=UPI00163BBB10|nr:leucine-rich repeat, immunoglobulin-like domain and transmembrane domain-containing protein 2 [Egretta garzetta]